MIDTTTLPVSEVFGPVWQGEGSAAGRRCAFIRLGHCNLSCEWCDTPFTWDATRYPLDFDNLTPEAIMARVPGLTSMIVLSGGEPLMHQGREAFRDLLDRAYDWHIETNGTITPREEVVARTQLFSVSPKINTHDALSKRIKPKVLEAFAQLAYDGKAIFKFVCKGPSDVRTVSEMVDGFMIPRGSVWIMPEGTNAQAILDGSRQLADAVSDTGFNLTLRMQVLMYGTERAR